MNHRLPVDRLVEQTCCYCGIRFAMPESFEKRALGNSHINFYCPSGHVQHFPGEENEREKLQRERDRLKQDNAYQRDARFEAEKRADAEKRRASAFKGNATRLKNRVKASVCPCCNRTFQNLARHMEQHSKAEIDALVEQDQEVMS